ncbi:MAG: DinB family protein [Terracidiphilus sp.]
MPARKPVADHDSSLRKHLIDLLAGGQAHATFDKAVKNLTENLRGKQPKGAEHSPWEILEHLRIAQWDILEFTGNPSHQSPDWPSGYWPAQPSPPDAKAWDKSVRAFRRNLKALCDLVADPATNLYARIPHGEGQTILREALLAADHNAYHLGELVLVRRLLGAWK